MEFFGGILETQSWPGYNNQRKNHIYSTKSMSYVMMTNIKLCNLSAKQLSADIRYRAWWKLMSWLANLLILQQCKKFKSSRFQSLLIHMLHAPLKHYLVLLWMFLKNPVSGQQQTWSEWHTEDKPPSRGKAAETSDLAVMKLAQWASANRLSTETPDSAYQNVPAIRS